VISVVRELSRETHWARVGVEDAVSPPVGRGLPAEPPPTDAAEAQQEPQTDETPPEDPHKAPHRRRCCPPSGARAALSQWDIYPAKYFSILSYSHQTKKVMASWP